MLHRIRHIDSDECLVFLISHNATMATSAKSVEVRTSLDRKLNSSSRLSTAKVMVDDELIESVAFFIPVKFVLSSGNLNINPYL